MKKLITVALSLMFVVCLSYTVIAGSLEPSGPPTAGSGMYTLQNLYDYLTSGTALTVQSGFQEPASGPTGGTMKTTKEIGDAIKALLDQSDVYPDNVESGKRFFCTQAGSWGIQTGTLSALPRPTATPTPTTTPTTTPTPSYASCKAIKTAIPTASDGVYTINPSGTAPFQAYCDMTTDGGGWTLVHTRSSSTNYDSGNFDTANGTNLTDPTTDADNVYKGVWSKLGFTTVRYQLNNYAVGATLYFNGIGDDAVRDYAKTALYTMRNIQTYSPDCSLSSSGANPITHCGTLGSSNISGWVADPPTLSGSYCWINCTAWPGAGCCNGTACSNTRARIWVR